jgi:hypothetical protein
MQTVTNFDYTQTSISTTDLLGVNRPPSSSSSALFKGDFTGCGSSTTQECVQECLPLATCLGSDDVNLQKIGGGEAGRKCQVFCPDVAMKDFSFCTNQIRTEGLPLLAYLAPEWALRNIGRI